MCVVDYGMETKRREVQTIETRHDLLGLTTDELRALRNAVATMYGETSPGDYQERELARLDDMLANYMSEDFDS